MNKKIIIAKDNEIAYNYLVDNFAGSGIKFKIKKSNYFIIIQVDLDNSLNDIFVKYMAKAIILSHKYKEIMSAFEELPMSYANIACISALLYFDLAHQMLFLLVLCTLQGENNQVLNLNHFLVFVLCNQHH